MAKAKEKQQKSKTLPALKEEAAKGFVQMQPKVVKKFQAVYELERQHAQELELLSEMTRLLLMSQNPDLVLGELAEQLAKLTQADDCYITSWNPENNMVIPKATTASLKIPYETDTLPHHNISMTASVLKAGHALAADDVFDSPHISPDIARRYPSRSLLGVPLVFRDHKLGAALIAFNSPHHFSPEEIQRAERAANHVAVALWNAQQDQKIKQRLQEQETLARITTALSQLERVGLPNVLDLIVNSARELIPEAQKAVIHLIDAQHEYLIPEAVSGYEQFAGNSSKMRVGEGIAGLAILDGKSIYIPSIEEDARFVPPSVGVKFRSLLVAPIFSSRQKLGTISVQSENPYSFTENNINLLSELGQQAAIGIENARLYDAAQQELRERILAEEALRSSEDRYRTIAEDIPAMICRFLADGTLTFVNSSYSQFFGKPSQELLGNPLAQANTEQRAAEKNKIFTKEHLLITYEQQEVNSNGEKRWVQWIERLIDSQDRAHAECQSIGVDITDRKLAELERERLLQTAQEQRLLAETSADATLALVSHNEIRKVLDEILNQVQKLLPGCATNIALLENDQLRTAAWRGYENRGDDVFRTLVKHPRLFPVENALINNPHPLIVQNTQEFPNWRFVKGLEWIRSNACLPLLWKGDLLGLLYIDEAEPNRFSLETIERLKPLVNATTVALESAILIETTQQALKETSALYRINQGLVALHVDELLKDAVELLKNNFDYYHVQVFVLNPVTGNFLLKAASGEVGKKLTENGHELRAGAGIIGYAAETGTPFFTNNVDEVVFFLYDPYLPETKAEMSVPVKNGDTLYGILDIQQTSEKPFTQRDQQLVVTVADQLALALHKAELYENLQTALHQEKAIRNQMVQNERLTIMGRLLASVSHELNNPLQAIQNALFLLKEERGISEQGRNDLEIVLAESERMAGMIQRLRATYRPAQAEDLEPTRLNNIIEDVYALIATHLRKNEVVFEFHPDDALPIIPTVPDQIRQVALNLLMNAVQAMPNGGRLIVSTSHLADTREVLITVTDNGEGIEPAILPHIFDPFVTNKKSGTGIGLTISHDIIIKHRGRLTAENNPTPGATFKVYLPVEPIPLSELP